MNEIAQTAEKLASGGDRLLFVFTLLAGGIAFAWVLRAVSKYFMQQHERLIADHREDRKHYQASLEQMAQGQLEIISEATSVMKQCLEELKRRPGVFVALAMLWLFAGCGMVRSPQRGGSSQHQSPTGQSSLQQSDNPLAASSQDTDSETETVLRIPAGSKIEEPVLQGSNQVTRTIVLAAEATQTTRTVDRSKSRVGAAQKDLASIAAAKLGAMKGIPIIGALVFLFGVASIAYPPLRIAIGSVTTSAMIILGGLALIVLPMLVVGNELLILGGVFLAVALWFVAHRHGVLKARAS